MPKPNLTPLPRGTEFASSHEAIPAILQMLDKAQRILICGHVRPDGDCIGCLVAADAFLRARGKDTRIFFRGPLQHILVPFLPEGVASGDTMPVDFQPDLTLCLDVSSANRIIEDFDLYPHRTILNIDHHLDNTRYGDWNWVEASAAAAGEIVFHLLEAAGPGAITPEIATALYLAVMTDTGGFRYGNTTAETFSVAQRLVQLGAQPAVVARAVWENRSRDTLKQASTVLANLRFRLGGQLVWGELTQEVLSANGGEAQEPDGLSGEMRGIQGVEVAILLREAPDGSARVSLRSTGRVNVSAIAATLGGGGHVAAAGAEVPGPYAKARHRVVETVCRQAAAQLGVACDNPEAGD